MEPNLTKEISHYISRDRGFCHGRPRFRGTRIPLSTVLELLGSGMTIEEILRGYPSLNKRAVQAAIRYAAVRIQDEEFIPLLAKAG